MGLKDHTDDKFPRNKVYQCGMVVLLLCVLATAMGCTAIVMGSQANVCLTPYSYSKWRTNLESKERMKWTSATQDNDNLQWKTMGWYSAPTSATHNGVTWIEEDPMNCITECQMNCTGQFTEQAVMLRPAANGGCRDCLLNCTHPWGENIETCHLAPACSEDLTGDKKKHAGIVNFCLPVARCFQACAGRGYAKIDAWVGAPNIKAGPIQWQEDAAAHDSDKVNNPAPAWTTAGYEKHGKDDVAWYGPKEDNKKLRCIKECEYDGKLTVGFGITAMVLVWLAPFALVIGSGTGELRSLVALVFAVLFWAASLILCTDALLLNMMRNEDGNRGGRGWEMLYYEQLPQSFEILGGDEADGKLKVTFNWMMHVIFGFGLMCNLFTLLAYYDSKEIWNRRPERAEQEPARPPSPPREPPKPKPKPMSYYNEDQAKEDQMMNQGARALSGGDNLFDVDIGLRWERKTGNNGVDETVIKEIIPGGAAEKALNSGINGKNRLQPGDVVLLIGNIVDGQEDYPDMHNIYEVPYSEWVKIVRSQPPGTKVRFMFARHAEFMKYQFDIVREPIGGSAAPIEGSGTRFGNPYPYDMQEEEAGVSFEAMRKRSVSHV